MRELQTGSKKHTKVVALDDKKFGANHFYLVASVADSSPLTEIKFQTGPIKENGVNGCHNEDLIAIIIDRLNDFQATDFKCRENALAITKLEETLHWLSHRTLDREKRGVEGTHQK